IEVAGVGERAARVISHRTLAEVIEPRYEELFTLVHAELRRSGFSELIASGIVLTGGSAKVKGCVGLAEEVFHMPVRMGYPQNISGLTDIVNNPAYSTGVGLLLYGFLQQQVRHSDPYLQRRGKSVWKRVSNWFEGHF
ncbi:MAG TPA: cell division FtsA domain-containing protein, partial [Gammaproteobacteria bacterium]|nr:cell division FtsA domain-containing protein [Gammaproteobacteria bacterium]